MIRAALGALTNLLYPPVCLVCRQRIYGQGPNSICGGCLAKIERNRFDRLLIFEQDKRDIGNIFAVCRYDSVLRECLHLFKYKGKLALAKPLADLMINFAKTAAQFDIRSYDMLVPVPLAASRARGREFNQAELLARHISREFNIGVSAAGLSRVRFTKPQSGLTKCARRDNVKGAFRAKDGAVFAQRDILLVDDLITTGATLNECAKTLVGAGARSVDALVLAHG